MLVLFSTLYFSWLAKAQFHHGMSMMHGHYCSTVTQRAKSLTVDKRYAFVLLFHRILNPIDGHSDVVMCTFRFLFSYYSNCIPPYKIVCHHSIGFITIYAYYLVCIMWFETLNCPRMCSLALRAQSQLTVEKEYSATDITKCSSTTRF